MKHLNVFILLFLINTLAFAQVPSEINGINYQGIAREADGTPIADNLIDIRITILDNSNANIFQETHDDVSTNQFGLFTLIIGSVNSLQSSLWSSATQIITEADFGSGYDEIGTVNLAAVPYAFKAKYEGQKIDFNTNSGYLRISNGTKDANGNPVFIDSTQISISGGGTDDQTITDFELTSTNMLNIEIEDGNTMSVDLSDLIDDSDSDSQNEIQDLTLNTTTNILTITNNNGATSIDLSPYLELPSTATTGQVLTWSGSTWEAQNSGTGADNWGTQVVNISGTNISGDGTSGSPLTVSDGDGDATNELQTISKSGTTVTLSNGGGSFTDDDTQLTEAQVDAYANDNGYLTSFSEVDGSITNEIQDISFSGNNLSISSGSTIDLSSLQDGTGTDTQQLSITGSTLAITNGNSITLPSGSDNQDLSLSGNNLTLTNDGTPVDMSGYLDNTDSQNLTLSGNNLSISGGNSITLPLGTDNQDLSLSGNNLTLTNDGTPVDLSGYLDNTDSQNLTLSGNNLSISGGNSVDLSSLKDQDWYEASSTSSPNDINDNIFTMGRVGIGINNPGYKLDIQNGANSVLNLKSTVNGNAQVFIDGMVGNSLVNFKINGSNVGTVGANTSYTFLSDLAGTSLVSRNGDIGIGTTSPIRPVDLVSNSYGFSQINTTGNVRIGTYIGNSYTSSNIEGGSIGTETDNPFFIYIGNSGEKLYIGNSSQSYNVGIGTNDPNEKLDVEGSIEIDDEYRYENVKTKVKSFHPHIFQSNRPDVYDFSGSLGVNTYLTFTTGGTSFGYSNAYVDLPNGAIVTKVEGWIYDNLSTNPVRISLYRKLVGGTSNTLMGQAESSTANASTSIQNIVDNTINFSTIDNDNYSYMLIFTGRQNSSNSRLYGAKITYTISKAD